MVHEGMEMSCIHLLDNRFFKINQKAHNYFLVRNCALIIIGIFYSIIIKHIKMICIGSKVQNCCGITIGIVTPRRRSVLKNGVGLPALSQL